MDTLETNNQLGAQAPAVLTDLELVNLSLVQADNFAFLVDRYKLKLAAYIKRLTNVDEDDLEDILQEVFIKVYLNLNEFNKDLKFSSWIYRITHNQVISRHRKIQARPEGYKVIIDDALVNSLRAEVDIKGDIDKQILQKAVNDVLNRIHKKYRDVVILKFLEEKSYQEISDILKKPTGTIASLMNKAKKEFKQALEAQNFKF